MTPNKSSIESCPDLVLRNLRCRVAELLNKYAKFSNVAVDLGITEKEARQMWMKHWEVQTAEHFQASTKLLKSSIGTLRIDGKTTSVFGGYNGIRSQEEF